MNKKPDGLNLQFSKQEISRFSMVMVIPYPATIFCPENVVCFLHLLHIVKCVIQTIFFYGSKQYEP